MLAQNTSETAVPILVDRTEAGRGITTERFSLAEMNTQWLDVGVAGQPVQCDQADGTCDEMAAAMDFRPRVSKEASEGYKYVLDIDGCVAFLLSVLPQGTALYDAKRARWKDVY